ncbi:MAG: NADH-quinone oxidoreductase subunit G [Gammaproteobacteria bacterium]|nr:NADH-quinone oxidoreductase subunit G [Gammaproteobacteria bacterium]
MRNTRKSKMATIEIDGKSYEAEAGRRLIDVADAHGINIPRFCYHKKLSVVASCRMCLVDVEKIPKPVPACNTSVTDGMKVFTRSSRALGAQKAVMEFLLINHPLDCPVCDQGGECELQDVAVGYGGDVSRYSEAKRVVKDEDIGPLIATEMNRCIQCTRCVRFGDEICGMRELGATGRGEHMRIGTYINKTVDSELSGNVIDLCPVGALTSKPFRFLARAWEIQQYDAIAPHDMIGSNIHLHVRGNKVIRVVPRENEAINEIWLSDRDRFSYQGLNAADRLTAPLIKRDGKWQTTDWETALEFAADGLKQVISKHQGTSTGALASPAATVEELYLLQKLMRGIGSRNIDHRLRQNDFSDQDQAPLFPYLGQTIADLEQSDAALVIGSHLRKEQPLINHRLRKAVQNQGARFMLANPADYEFNMAVAEKIIAAPDTQVAAVAGIAKALTEEEGMGVDSAMAELLADVPVNETQRNIAKNLQTAKRPAVLLGNLAAAHPDAAALRTLAATIAGLSGAYLGYLGESANSAGAWMAGVLPHRGPGGKAVESAGMDAGAMLADGIKGYVLLGAEPELESWHGSAKALTALRQAEFTISLSAYRTPAMESYADVLLPMALFAETSGTYVNGEGVWQSFQGAVKPPGEARPGWKILRVLGNLFDVDGFDYTASDEVRDELRREVPETPGKIENKHIPASLRQASAGIQRISELPAYAADALVRRASALQETRDAQTCEGVHINARLAADAGVETGQQVMLKQGDDSANVQVVVDERVPDGCALIYPGRTADATPGPWHGSVEIAPA